VTIVGGDRTLEVGASLALTATVAATGTASTAVTWTSSDPVVATIDSSGAVTGLTAGTTTITATSNHDTTKSDAITLTVDSPDTLEWTRQFGTSQPDRATGITTAANGHVYATGYTYGALEGSHLGNADAFIRSYDVSGNLRWTRQFGTLSRDEANAIASDADGNVYVTGFTEGALEGAPAGGGDAFIRSYDSDGDLRWTKQFGTSDNDFAYGITTDADGNVYAAGYTGGVLEDGYLGSGNAFLRSYDSGGDLRWTRQFGTSGNEEAQGIATDAAGNVYTSGYTTGSLEGDNSGFGDAFLRSYDSDGTLRWTRQFGTPGNDFARGIATDGAGNVYATGFTQGNLDGTFAGGSYDAYIRSYDGSGTLRWTRQFGTAGNDFATGIAIDVAANVYATGSTEGSLEGDSSGFGDAFIRSYDSSGTLRWTRQFGTTAADFATGIAADADSHLYVSGETLGDLGGTNIGSYDAFIRKSGP
jgi:hypothetical protein